MNNWQISLVAYGTHLLAAQLGKEWTDAASHAVPPGPLAQEVLRRANSYHQEARLKLARTIVRHAEPALRQDPEAVASVFSLLPPLPTSLDVPQPRPAGPSPDQAGPAQLAGLWDGFWSKLSRLSTDSQFDSFFYLMAYYGRRVAGSWLDPARPGLEKGISVFEQFKAVAALAHCLDPNLDDRQPIGLVVGDLPGIQRILYTLTSRGAAKTLRGRSAYLQLLGDAIVRALLRDLDLPWANVVFNAGGNFMLLIRGGQGAEVGRLGQGINQKLLELHRAELHLALACTEIQARLVTDASHRAEPGTLSYARQELHRQLIVAKDTPFAGLPLEDPGVYAALFEPLGQGGAVLSGDQGNLCAICHTEVSPERGTQVYLPAGEDAEEMILCDQCHSLGFYRVGSSDEQEILPYRLARAEALFIASGATTPLDARYLEPNGGSGNPAWDVALQVFGFRYEFQDKLKPGSLAGKEGHLLYLSADGFDVAAEPGIAYGFWPLARLTPWQNDARDSIRDFHVMARDDATGLPRYGVLRMDVDNLGRTLLGDALPYPDLLHLSALSAALNEFFGARLEAVCRGAVTAWYAALGRLDQPGTPSHPDISYTDRKLPYIIYAGGDDLFIVGPWDVLPPLAQAIRRAFDSYTAGRLTMSAGISLAREKYPLYRLAEDAGSALDQSKSNPGKDALSFLGKTLTWGDGHHAQGMVLKLAGLIADGAEGDQGRAPHALLAVLGYVAYLYQKIARPGEPAASRELALGRWLWVLHYGLRRLGQRVKPPLREEIYALPGDFVLDINNLETARAFRPIRYLDLVVRWAEFLIRKGENR